MRNTRPIPERRNGRTTRDRTGRGAVITLPASAAMDQDHDRRWGVILAGGDGARLMPLTREIYGAGRPKQFCPLLSDKTLLGETLSRARRSIPAGQVLTSLAGHHYNFYSQERGLCPSSRVVQPMNKGTAPAIVHSLLSIARMDEDALVAVLPSDHHYSDDDAFTAALDRAFRVAEEQPDRIVLLGAPAAHPETEYGWIELGEQAGGEPGLHLVGGFREKPGPQEAQTLLAQGAVWNTFVMIGHVRAFLDIAHDAVPELVEALSQARLWRGEETHIEYSIYLRISTGSFSTDVLSDNAKRLLTLVLAGVAWSDLGNPERLTAVARKAGGKPGWLGGWAHATASA